MKFLKYFCIFLSYPVFCIKDDIIATAHQPVILQHSTQNKTLVTSKDSCLKVKNLSPLTVIGKKNFTSCSLQIGQEVVSLHFLPNKLISFYLELKKLEHIIPKLKIHIQKGNLLIEGEKIKLQDRIYIRKIYEKTVSSSSDYNFNTYLFQIPFETFMEFKNYILSITEPLPGQHYELNNDQSITIIKAKELESHKLKQLFISNGIFFREIKKEESDQLYKVSLQFHEKNNHSLKQGGLDLEEDLRIQTLPDFKNQSIQNFAPQNGDSTGQSRRFFEKTLLVGENQSGELEIGGELPIQGKSGRSSTITWKKYGLQILCSMKRTNHKKRQIYLDLITSFPDFGQSLNGIPSMKHNKIKTTLSFDSSDWFSIGELFALDEGESSETQSLLGAIPLIGSYFYKKNDLKQKKEIFVKIKIEPENGK